MNEQALLQHITLNPKIFGGKPILRGRRLAVEHILGMLACGLPHVGIVRLVDQPARRQASVSLRVLDEAPLTCLGAVPCASFAGPALSLVNDCSGWRGRAPGRAGIRAERVSDAPGAPARHAGRARA